MPSKMQRHGGRLNSLFALARSAILAVGVFCVLSPVNRVLGQDVPATPGTGLPAEAEHPAESPPKASNDRADKKDLKSAFSQEQLDEIRSLFGDVLKAEEVKKKKQEEQRKKESDELGQVVGSQLDLRAEWRNGVWFVSPAKDFQFHVGGAFQGDLSFFNVPSNVEFGTKGTGPFDDAYNVRRGRLRAEGTLYEVVDFCMEMEFFNGVEVTSANIDQARNRTFNTPGPTDLWAEIKHLPLIGYLRIGNMKEPFGLEHLNSYRYLEFLERSYLFDAFTPTAFNNGFTPGIMIHNTYLNERGTWWIGVFKNDTSLFGFGIGDGEYAVTGRLTGLPLYDEDNGLYLVHIGIAGSHRDTIRDQYRYRIRNEIRNAPFPLLPLIADTGTFNADSQDFVNVEHAQVWGPLTIQAEYAAGFNQDVTQSGLPGRIGTFFVQGMYAEALWFLTGEHRTWDRTMSIFGRVIPNEPFFWTPGKCNWICGTGAWEVGARYSYMDLSNSGILGGVLQDVTLGLNWYLNTNAKIQWNYDVVRRSDTGGTSDGVIQGFGMRMAVDF